MPSKLWKKIMTPFSNINLPTEGILINVVSNLYMILIIQSHKKFLLQLESMTAKMDITVEEMTGRSFKLSVSPTDTIADIKKMIHQQDELLEPKGLKIYIKGQNADNTTQI